VTEVPFLTNNTKGFEMAFAVPLNRANIHLVAAKVNTSVEELLEKRDEAEHLRKEEHDKQWAIDFLGKDEQWYDEAMLKIKEIAATLPDDLHHKERTIKLYGWIAETIKHKALSIPMETDTEYARADSVEMILTNPKLYLKIINWD